MLTLAVQLKVIEKDHFVDGILFNNLDVALVNNVFLQIKKVRKSLFFKRWAIFISKNRSSFFSFNFCIYIHFEGLGLVIIPFGIVFVVFQSRSFVSNLLRKEKKMSIS